jgi:predicted CoA-binding protein
MNADVEQDVQLMRHILETSETIAVVGASTHEDKDAHSVPAYLKEQGYQVIPVNPNHDAIWGEKSYGSLRDIPVPVDVVEIFRPGEEAGPIVEEAIEIGAKTVWMQVGIRNEAAAARAREAGLNVVMDACMRVAHRLLFGPRQPTFP